MKNYHAAILGFVSAIVTIPIAAIFPKPQSLELFGILLGLLFSPYFLALGYFGHGIWDLVHHPKLVQTRVPQSYIYLCSIYDWVVGIFIIVWWM